MSPRRTVGALTLTKEEIARREAYRALLDSANAANRSLFASQIQDLAPCETRNDGETQSTDEAPAIAQPEDESGIDDTDQEGESHQDSGIDLSAGPEDIVRTKIKDTLVKIAAIDLKKKNLIEQNARFTARHEEVLAQAYEGNSYSTKPALLDISSYMSDVVKLYEMEKNLAGKLEEWLQAHANFDVLQRNKLWPNSVLRGLVSKVEKLEAIVRNWDKLSVSMSTEVRGA